jgi:4-aminobutyrate aminotransferase-like enzyme
MRSRWICRLTNNSVEDLRDLNAASLRERDARVIANIARLRFSPLSLIGGSGNCLIEEGGRQLLDLSASFGAAMLGYSHAAITRAVAVACTNMAGASLLIFHKRKLPLHRNFVQV